MKLNKEQAKRIKEIAESYKGIHEEVECYGDEAYLGDSKDTILQFTEELIFSLGLIDKKMF